MENRHSVTLHLKIRHPPWNLALFPIQGTTQRYFAKTMNDMKYSSFFIPTLLIRSTFLLLACSGLVSSAIDSNRGGFLPPGFYEQGVAKVDSVSTFNFASIPYSPSSSSKKPTAVLFAASKDGFIQAITNCDNDNNQAPMSVITALDYRSKVCHNGERGIHHVLPHPNFQENRFVYVAYTFKKYGNCNLGGASNQAPVNRISRFQVRKDDYRKFDATTEFVLLETDPLNNKIHNGGDMLFGNDGYLYITTGEDGTRSNAQTLNNVFGKVLRLTEDGSIPKDNPYYNVDSSHARCNFGSTKSGLKCQEIFAFGFRNPFRMALNPNPNVVGAGATSSNTEIFVCDVGGKAWEEISVTGTGYAGRDYGWGIREGPCRTDSYTDCGLTNNANDGPVDPIYWYSHVQRGSGCITGGVFVPKGVWPPEYYNSFLFTDFVWGEMYVIQKNPKAGCASCRTPIPEWTNTTFLDLSTANVGRPVDMIFGPYKDTMALYYTVRVSSGQDNIRRIIYQGNLVNLPPHAEFTVSETNGPVGVTIFFDGSASYDPDGDDIELHWDFGDGATSNKVSPTHRYLVPGKYDVHLTVVDEDGLAETFSLSIDIGAPPIPNIIHPVEGTTFAVGDIFSLIGNAIDGNNGQLLPSESLMWEVRQHHNTHYHPFLDRTTGNTIVIDPAPSPEDYLAATNSYLEVLLTATDSYGISTTVTTNLMPKMVYVDLRSVPSGLEFLVDGSIVITPDSVATWTNHELHVEAHQRHGPLVFDHWSNGEPADHIITVGDTDFSLVAMYEKLPTDKPSLSPTTVAPPPPPPPLSRTVPLNGLTIPGLEFDNYLELGTSRRGGCGSNVLLVDAQPTRDMVCQYRDSSDCNIGWTQPGEWVSYDFTISELDDYLVWVRVASNSPGQQIRVEVIPTLDAATEGGGGCQKPFSRVLDVPSHGWQEFVDVKISIPDLEYSNYRLAVHFETGRVNLCSVGIDHSFGVDEMLDLPQLFNALEYSKAIDSDHIHEGDCAPKMTMRMDDSRGVVDSRWIANDQECLASGGPCYVGFTVPGEILRYDFTTTDNDDTAVAVNIRIRVASRSKRAIMVEVDGNRLYAESPGLGWSTFQDVVFETVILYNHISYHSLHVVFVDGYTNLCLVEVTYP